MYERSNLQEGMTVLDAGGAKLGKIIRFDAGSFIVEKGLFFKEDYLLSYADIADIRDGQVILSARTVEFGTDKWKEHRSRWGTGEKATGLTGKSMEEIRVPVAEEQLIAEKRTKEAGEVRIKKDVVTEHRQISVPVTREEIRVERTAIPEGSRPAEGAVFKEEEKVIPLVEEEVEIRKRPVVREEVRVSKEKFTEERRADAEVRKERVEVEGAEERRTGFRNPDDDDLTRK